MFPVFSVRCHELWVLVLRLLVADVLSSVLRIMGSSFVVA